MSTISTPWKFCSTWRYTETGICPAPARPTRRTGFEPLTSLNSWAKSMIVALGYSSSGTMKTGRLRVFLMALSCCAKGSLSGPPRISGSPASGTRTAPLSNCGHHPVRYQALARLNSS